MNADVLGALRSMDAYVQVPLDIIEQLGPRDAIVASWLWFRTRNVGWMETNLGDFAEEIGLSAAQVKRSMSDLIEAGHVEAEQPDLMRRTRRYRIAGTSPAKDGNGSGQGRNRPTRKTAPSLLPIEEDQEVVQKKDMAADAASVAFDAFWEQYPKSRRRERANCLALYRKAAKHASTEVAIRLGLERWVRYWRDAGTEERFITTSIVWLRNRRWEDDPTLSKPTNGASVPARLSPDSPLRSGSLDREGVTDGW